MKWFSRFLVLYILLIFSCLASAQVVNIGIPFSTHFFKNEYRGGTQNWGFDQDKSGRLFVANNNGLLIYSGKDWKTLALPNRTIVRSVLIDESGKVFVGGQGIFGYFSQDYMGRWEYTGLSDQILGKNQVFADIWDICQYQNKVFFRATDRVFLWENNEIKILFEQGQTTYLSLIKDEIYLHDLGKGLLRYDGDRFIQAGEKAILADIELAEMLPLGDQSILIATAKNGLFEWREGAISTYQVLNAEFFEKNRIQAAALLSNDQIAVGTADAGIVVIDNSGRPIYQLDKKYGLQNSSVRSLYTDHAHNLWVGLENGIDMIHTRSPFTHFIPNDDLESSTYAIKVFDQQLFLGQTSGLYSAPLKSYYNPFSEEIFRKIPGSEGQVWGLDIVDEALLMGHHEGAFMVEKKQLKKLNGPGGIWNFTQLRNHPDSLLAGAYHGLCLYKREGDRWVYLRDINQFQESSRFVEEDNSGTLWISHPYRGVYSIDNVLDPRPEVNLYSKSSGLPSDNFNHIFEVNGEQVIVGETGIYRYDYDLQSFVIHEAYARIFDDDERVIRLIASSYGDVWFVTERATGVLRLNDQGIEREIEKHIFPEISDKLVAGFEHIYPYDKHNVFFGALDGVIHLDPTRLRAPDTSWSVSLESVLSIPGDTMAWVRRQEESAFPRSVSGLYFNCAATNFKAPERTRFRYRLKNLDKSWSQWTNQAQKEYTNLPPGSFTFLYEAKSSTGVIRRGEAFRFSIAPPWYASPLAFSIYAILALIGILALILVPRRAYEKEKEYLETVHKRKEATHIRELEQTEKALAQVENERLEDEVRYKTRELASTTMHLVQKNELLIKLKGELEDLARRVDKPDISTDLKKLVRLLKHDIRLDDDWEQFSHHFDQVHRDFVQRLIEQYPQLTPNDHRLCAYLRMNLSSKEIAPLMNISVRGVEVSRYRLRKKIELPTETNLTEFMMRF